jgi:hypothetical protein
VRCRHPSEGQLTSTVNVHEQVLRISPAQAGILIDGLSSDRDVLWPTDRWPPIRFDRPLGVGAVGGHGPVRYYVEGYEPGRSVRFRFTGSEGSHGLELEEEAPGTVRLRHELVIDPKGVDRLVWAWVGRPLHDALVEDAFDRAEAFASGRQVSPRAWSWRVRVLRRILGWSGRDAEGPVTLLDGLLPEYEFSEVHRVLVSATPERALEAVKRATLGEMPLVRPLFVMRSLPARLAGRRRLPSDRVAALYKQMSRFLVLLAEEPGREVVLGGIGQMWRLSGGTSPAFRNASAFIGFWEPGYAKVAMSFVAVPRDGRTELGTETRVLTTDPASRHAFGRYWRVIRPWSGLIRRSWLRAARRRAEGDDSPSRMHAGGGDVGPEANGVSGAARAVLAAVFAGAGAAKLTFRKDRLRAPMPWVDDFSQGTVRLIGALELLGAAGLVAPRRTGTLPRPAPLAAAGLAMVMVGGFATHVRRREYLRSGSNVVLFALAAFVARGLLPRS